MDNLLWAYKMYLLDGLNSSVVLRESLKVCKDEKFRDFIKDLTANQVVRILEAGPFDYDVDAPQSLDQLQGALNSILSGVDPEEVVKKLNIVQHKPGMSTTKKIIAGMGVATLIGVIGYLLYKKFRDKCKQACRNSKDLDCMKKCKASSIRSVVTKLNSERSKCKGDRKCIEKFDKQIIRWREKLRKYS